MNPASNTPTRPAWLALPAYWGRYFFGFMVLLALHRLAFMLFYFADTFRTHTAKSFWAFWYALRLDAAAISYTLLPPVLLGILAIGAWRRPALALLRVWFWLLYVLFTLACAGDVIIYREWGAKLHFNALRHLVHPSELVNTGTGNHFVPFGAVVSVFLLPAIPADRWVHAPLKKNTAPPVYLAPALLGLLMGGLAFVLGR